MKMRNKLLSAAALALSAGTFCTQPYLNAQSERDIKFSRELNKINFYDYSVRHLEKVIAAKPADLDKVSVQLADTLLLQNKIPDAMKIIQGIKPGTEAYYLGEAAVGVYLYKTKKEKDAIVHLEKVLQYCKDLRAKGQTEDPEVFETPLACLLYSYKNVGESGKADALLEWIQSSSGGEGTSDREKTYTKVNFTLDSIEAMKENDKTLAPEKKKELDKSRQERAVLFAKRNNLKPAELKKLKEIDKNDWQSIVYNAIFELEDVQWGGQDVITALASANIARCFILLDQYDNALAELNKNKDLFALCDESFVNAIKDSPGASAKYWEANAYLSKYESLKDKSDKEDEALKALKGAFVNYGRLLKNYPGYRDGSKAYSEFMKVADELAGKAPDLVATIEKQKASVPVPTGGSGIVALENLVPPEAEQNFKDKKYAAVIDALLPVLQENRKSVGLPPLLTKLVESLANERQTLEAQAIAKFMATQYGKSDQTPIALSRAASVYWPDQKASMGDKDDAIVFYNMFLKSNIAHPAACDIAMKIAQEYYNRANSLGVEANKLAGDEKKAKVAETFAMFDRAIPRFEIVINNFGNRRDRVESAYLLMALSYASSEKYMEAANTYKHFCEENPENKINLASAKLSISDNLYKAGLAVEDQAKAMKAAAYAIPESKEMKTEEGTDSSKPEAAKSETKDAAPAKNGETVASEEEEDAAAIGTSPDNVVDKNATSVVLDIASREGKLAEADKLEKYAASIYSEAVEHINELLNKWLKKNGELASVADDSKVMKTAEDATHLRPWLMDAAGDKNGAVKEFAAFIEAYPKNKSVPKCMMRMGVIYTELGKDKEAEVILSRLSNEFKDTLEGKNAKFYLARSLYNNQNYTKSIDIIKEIFENRELIDNLSTQNLRWIASNMSDCGGQHPVTGAALALTAADILLKQLENPNLSDWVGVDRSNQLKMQPKELDKVLMHLKEKILLDAGVAAYYAGNYTRAVDAYDKIIKLDNNTPYFYEVYFGRADAYVKLKQYDPARTDLAEIAVRANTLMQYSIYYKAQCLLGEIALEEKNYNKAFACFNIVAAPAFMFEGEDPDAKKHATEEARLAAEKDKEAAREWIEFAIYKAAYTAALLGREKDKNELVAKYKKNFIGGRFSKEIDSLPAVATVQQDVK